MKVQKLLSLLAWFTLGVLFASFAEAYQPELSGRVVDGNAAPVAGARISLHAKAPSTPNLHTETDLSGAFSIVLPASGDYVLDVEREGYYQLRNHIFRVEDSADVTLTINAVREVFQSLNVDEQPSPVDVQAKQPQGRLTGTEVNDIPYSGTHSLRNSMKLMPGVLQDQQGGLHFYGSSENQVQYVLNGFDITDPVTGQFRTSLAVEGVRSLEYSAVPYSSAFGRGSAGVLAVRTENGTDRFRYTATNFFPGLRLQQGMHLSNWYPRVGISGPISRGRAWFSDTFQAEHNTSLITALPEGQNTRSGWLGSNLLHTQANLSSRNILFADALFNLDNQSRVGLAPLDPVSTTQSVRGREYFGSIRDQLYIGGQSILEFGYGHNRFSNVRTPQGNETYVFSPEGRSGNYFVSSQQTASRDQGLVHAWLPKFFAGGSHQAEAGIDSDFLYYTGNFHRTGYELIGLSGQLLSSTSFIRPGFFGVHDTDVALWLADTWQISKRLRIDVGLRRDWDQLVSDAVLAPRIGFSSAPFANSKTRLSGGFSIARDAVPLEVFGRTLDQSALTRQFSQSAVPLSAPALTTFARGSALKLPRARIWNLSLDHQLAERLHAQVSYLRRRTKEGFSFFNVLDPGAPPSLLPIPNGVAGGDFDLTNLRHDAFDSVQVSVRHALGGQHEWTASYTWSRSQSNAVLDSNTSVPLQVLPALVPMPWDSPHRLLGWAYLPLPWKDFSLALLADARTGFPFSVQHETGIISETVNGRRYPFNFGLNVAIERIVTLRGRRFALRAGVNNLTNQSNATAVRNVIGSPQYLQFLGKEGRHLVFRVRVFGQRTP